MDEPSWSSIFYDVGKQGYKPLNTDARPIEKSPRLLYRTQIFLMSEEITHGREVYGFMDLLGDLGGVTEVIMLVFGIFLFPISEHSYTVQAAKKLFLAKAKDDKLFAEPIQEEGMPKFASIDPAKVPEGVSKNVLKDSETHRIIELSPCDNFLLFFSNLLGSFSCCARCWSKNDKLTKMYEEASDRIDAELDIVKLLRNIRNSKILLESMMDDNIRYEIAHSKKNCLNLDSEEEEDDDLKPEPAKKPGLAGLGGGLGAWVAKGKKK